LFLILGFDCYALGSGTTAANFLKIGVGTKVTPMGEAFTAFALDGTALYRNPAGDLPKWKKQEFWQPTTSSFRM